MDKKRLNLIILLGFAIVGYSDVFTITDEMLADMDRREEGAMHLHGRLVASSKGYTNEFVSPLVNYHTSLGLSEDEFAAALFSYARKNMYNTNLEYVAIALRARAATPETNSLPLVEALAQKDLPHDLVLPVANLLVAKNSSRLSVLVSPLVERMTPLERKCFALSTSDSSSVNSVDHIEDQTMEIHKLNRLLYTILGFSVLLGGILLCILVKRERFPRQTS